MTNRGGRLKNCRVTEPAKPLSAARRTQLYYQRKRRCQNCGNRLPRTRRVSSCASCARQHAERTRTRKNALAAAGRCTQCAREPLAPTSQRLGRICLEKQRDRSNRMRKKRRELGRCRDCQAQAGLYARCWFCRQKQLGQWLPTIHWGAERLSLTPGLLRKIRRRLRE